MKWLKYELQTTTEATDLVIDMLMGLGVQGVEVRDKLALTEEEKKQMYVDILPETVQDDGKATLVFYIETEDEEDENRAALYNSGMEILEESFLDLDALNQGIKEGLEDLALFVDIGEGSFAFEETSDMEWADKWKDFFKSFRIGENILIAPTWEEGIEKKEDDILIKIDPGIAFGTGSHETTRLCVKELTKYVKKGDNLLDVGCGSAILTIAGMKLGAKSAYAIDIDEVAVRVAKENLETNEIPKESVRLEAGNILEDEVLRNRVYETEYDIIVANILAPVLVPLTPIISPVLKKDGIYICSGIAKDLSEMVETAIKEAGLELVSKNEDGDWVSLTARK